MGQWGIFDTKFDINLKILISSSKPIAYSKLEADCLNWLVSKKLLVLLLRQQTLQTYYTTTHNSNYSIWKNMTWTFLVWQVRDVKPMVDTKPPRTYMHLHLKLKKLQVKHYTFVQLQLYYIGFARKRVWSCKVWKGYIVI